MVPGPRRGPHGNVRNPATPRQARPVQALLVGRLVEVLVPPQAAPQVAAPPAPRATSTVVVHKAVQ